MSVQTSPTKGTEEYIVAFKREFPHRAAMAKGQPLHSVLWDPPPEAPHNVAKMVEGGHIRLVGGRFIRP